MMQQPTGAKGLCSQKYYWAEKLHDWSLKCTIQQPTTSFSLILNELMTSYIQEAAEFITFTFWLQKNNKKIWTTLYCQPSNKTFVVILVLNQTEMANWRSMWGQKDQRHFSLNIKQVQKRKQVANTLLLSDQSAKIWFNFCLLVKHI